MKSLATFIMRGRSQAMMVASSLVLLSLLFPPMNIVSSAAIGLVTLRLGATEGSYLVIGSTVAAAVLATLIIGNAELALSYALVFWLPIWLSAICLRITRQLSLVIEILVVLTAALLAILLIIYPEIFNFWQYWLNPLLEPLLKQWYPQFTVTQIQQQLQWFYRFILTGLVAQTYLFTLACGLLLARGWQALLYNPGGFKVEYLALRGKVAVAIVTLLMLMIASTTSGLWQEISSNSLVILSAWYVLIGTAIVHQWLTRLAFAQFSIPLLYITLLLIPHLGLAIAMIGLIDTQLNLRSKILYSTSD
ncbi:MAG: hypothetical protein RL637_741 [Pseudomonadota bacterium]|jgi:hypothetical protein